MTKKTKAAGGSVWSPFYRNVTDEDLKVARELKLPIIVWTVNEADEMRDLIKRGVDGIITDYPDVLRDVMAEARMPLPKPTNVVP